MDIGLGGQPHTWPEMFVRQSQTFGNLNFLRNFRLENLEYSRLGAEPQTLDSEELEAGFSCIGIAIKSTLRCPTRIITQFHTQKKLFGHQNLKIAVFG